MRKIYAKFAEDTLSITSGSNILQSTSVQNLQALNLYQSDETVESETSDPFIDRFPWFRLIGRGLVFLSNLLIPCSVTQCICIVNEKGDVMGYLRIAVEPVYDADSPQTPNNPAIKRQSSISQFARIDFNDDDDVLQDILVRERALSDAEELVEREAENGKIIKRKNTLKEMFNSSSLMVGQEFIFRVSILQLTGLSKDYADVFCQFNFRHRHDEAFSTESVKNSFKNRAAGFYREQNIIVCVTKSFLEYLQTQPLIFELYGHYQQHPLHREAATNESGLFFGQNPAQNW